MAGQHGSHISKRLSQSPKEETGSCTHTVMTGMEAKLALKTEITYRLKGMITHKIVVLTSACVQMGCAVA